MSPATLAALEAALAASPDNHLLRRQIAGGYLANGDHERARDHAQALLRDAPSADAKLVLAEAYLGLGKPAAGAFVTEELLPGRDLSAGELARLRHLHLRLLLADGRRADAQAAYRAFELADEGFRDGELEGELKVRAGGTEEARDGDADEDLFFRKADVSFRDVGGMDAVKEEIRMKIIAPLANPELFRKYGKKAGGGILLYGPPGCGKTFLARATAGEIDARFLAIDLDDILSMWMGQSEGNLARRFAAARRRRPTVMFVDEIDALAGKRREGPGGRGLNTTINTFLRELDGLDDDNEGLLVIGATNLPWHLDTAFLRPGRFDRVIFVPPPDRAAREAILRIHLAGKPTDGIDYGKLAKVTGKFSGADLTAVVDRAVEAQLHEALRTGTEAPVTTKGLLAAVKQTRPSVTDWLNTARNYVLYSNASGLYDEVKAYLGL